MPSGRGHRSSHVPTIEHGLHSALPMSMQRQRPSVADLRDSFEQNVGTEAPPHLPRTPIGGKRRNFITVPKFDSPAGPPAGPSSSLRHSNSFPYPYHSSDLQATRFLTTPSSGGRLAGHGGTTNRGSAERLSAPKPSESPARRVSPKPTARRSPPAPSGIRRVESVLMRLGEPLSLGKSSKVLPKSKSGDSFFTRPNASHPDTATVGGRAGAGGKPIAASVPRIPEGGYGSEGPPRRMGKVADLRKLFDRPSDRTASPMPSLKFYRNRNRRNQEAKSDSQTGLPASNFSATCAPSLTTKISTTEFSRGFSGQLFDAASLSLTPRSANSKDPRQSGSPIKPRVSAQPESPVKSRIRQFETLGQGASPPKDSASPHATFGRNDVAPNRGKAPGAWRPVRQRGIKMWRRISQTISHSASSGDDTLYKSEDRNLSSVNLDARRAPTTSVPSQGRSSIFGHRFSRTFYMRHPSTTLSSRSSSSIGSDRDDTLATSVDSDMGHLTSGRRSCRPQYHRQEPRHHDFLALEHFPSGGDTFIDFSVDFGFDGNTESKPHRPLPEPRGATEAEASSNEKALPSHLQNLSPRPATPQEEPSALEKVRTQQASSREMRRRSRYEAKRIQREHTADKKEFHRDQRHWANDEQTGHSTFDLSPPYVHLPLRFPSMHFKSKDKGKQRATDGLVGEQGYGTPTAGSMTGNREWENKQYGGKDKEKSKTKKDRSWSKKTESGFVVRHADIERIREPKPRRPEQVRKLVNLYREKSASNGVLSRLGKGSFARSGGVSGGKS